MGIFLLSVLLLLAYGQDPPFSDDEMSAIQGYLMANVDTACHGCVLASPSTGSSTEPDYYYFWRRDGAISMDTVLTLSQDNNDQYDQQMRDYVQWVHTTQTAQPNPGYPIEGEPKFFVSGLVYNLPWMRPQDDGAALQAIVLTRYANYLLNSGNQDDIDYVNSTLYIANLSDGPSIKWDLEYTAHHWMDNTGDPWEEIFGDHFFSKYVQRKALIVGAELATTLGDTAAAAYYNQQASAINAAIDAHWVPSCGTITETMGFPPGFNKTCGLDAAVHLGSIYGDNGDGFYTPVSDRLRSSVSVFYDFMQNSANFPINGADDNDGLPGLLVGRYPNDIWNGVSRGPPGGNPWILCTFSLAQIYYANAMSIATDGVAEINDLNEQFFQQAVRGTTLDGSIRSGAKFEGADAAALATALVSQGDGMLIRVRYHTVNDQNHFNEEINKYSGYEWGARDLSWSYATLFTAMNVRNGAIGARDTLVAALA